MPVAFSNSSNIGRAQFSGQIEYSIQRLQRGPIWSASIVNVNHDDDEPFDPFLLSIPRRESTNWSPVNGSCR